MSGVNRAIVLGRLGRDPEYKQLADFNVVSFSVATSKQWKNKDGVKQEDTQWHNIVAYKNLAELCNKYLKKGKQVYVEGELQTRSWEKDGVTKWKTEIVASNVQFLSPADDSAEDVPAHVASSINESPAALTMDTKEDLPF